MRRRLGRKSKIWELMPFEERVENWEDGPFSSTSRMHDVRGLAARVSYLRRVWLIELLKEGREGNKNPKS